MKNFFLPFLYSSLIAILPLAAQVPNLINYQGRVAVGTMNFEGTGQFKFALVNGNGSTTYWSNNGSSVEGSQPTAAVSLTVTKGLYSVLLGDTAAPLSMTAIPASVFSNADLRLRVWFNDGVNGFQLLSPDQRLAPNGYLPDGTVTSGKIANGAVGSSQLAAGAVGATQLANGAVGALQIANGAIIGDGWQATTTTGAPSPRFGHTALWSGSEMLIWGGFTNPGVLGNGARFNPATGIWTAMASSGAPSARYGHVGVWTGTQMIIWGGYNGSSQVLGTGARYTPSTNTWATVASSGAPSERGGHVAVWTGTEMLVWGGYDGSNLVNTGSRYNPTTNTWSAMTTTAAPVARSQATAIWTGTEMIVWGGLGSGGSPTFNDGARYNPTTNTWTPTTITGAPSARHSHTAVWSGMEMIIFGKSGGPNQAGGRYNPTTDSWIALPTTGAPEGGNSHSAVWNGSAMLVWGGYNNNTLVPQNSGAIFNPTSNSWIPLLQTDAPTARVHHSAIWAGGEMIVWGGGPDNQILVSTGGRYGSQIAARAVGSSQLATNLTLDGTTVGTFSGGLTGNVTGSATNFTGNLSGDVTGTQSATVVNSVAGTPAASIAAGAILANTATSGNAAGSIVKRDASGGFAAGTITGTFSGNGSALTGVPASSVTGVLAFPSTSSSTVGVINQNGNRWLHTYGTNNFFAGVGAGNFTLSGSTNTGIGRTALAAITNGSGNTALGNLAMKTSTSGTQNTAVGSLALESNAGGNYNTAIGEQALNLNVSGINNTAVGKSALYSNTGSNNIALGASAGGSLTTGSNNIVIGVAVAGVAGESDTTRIGGTQTRAFMAGVRGVTASGGATVYVTTTGQLGTVTSSARYKEQIEPMEDASESILALRPVTFRYKPEIDAAGLPQYGLIAEEVAAVNPDLVVRDANGEIETVRYEQVNAMLLNEFLKERARVSELEARLEKLEKQLEANTK
jgi:N-acetylneuraminic acid mutarotase